MNLIRAALVLFVATTLLGGVIYPLMVYGIGQIAFSEEAEGSLVRHKGAIVGSSLIGQGWRDPRFFHGRPSAGGYDAMASGGSNLAPDGAAQRQHLDARRAAWGALDPAAGAPPADLLMASASGLDPHISVAAARYQAPRVARARGLDEGAVMALIEARVERGGGGAARVNVLDLNLALDAP